jgi:hypothetical protein
MTSNGFGSDDSTMANQDFPVRTTIVLPMALDRNLEIYCAKTGSGKSKLIEKLLFDFLSAKGFRPDKTPKSVELNICY